jgi:ABC-type lipoprotein release transport system permease subunit
VALLSKALAAANGLKLGDTFDLSGERIEIIGIFEADSGDLFGNNAVFLPLRTAQRITDKPGEISEAVIWADDVDRVDSVVAAIGQKIGNPNLTTNKAAFDEIASPLQNAKRGSQTGMIASLAACVAIILFATIMAVRGRMREIGILKAIGATNMDVMLQFAAETLAVTLASAIVAGVAAYLFAGSVADSMVEASVAGGTTSVGVSVSPAVFAYALGAALVVSIIGSCVPAWSVAKAKPAEVLRNE